MQKIEITHPKRLCGTLALSEGHRWGEFYLSTSNPLTYKILDFWRKIMKGYFCLRIMWAEPAFGCAISNQLRTREISMYSTFLILKYIQNKINCKTTPQCRHPQQTKEKSHVLTKDCYISRINFCHTPVLMELYGFSCYLIINQSMDSLACPLMVNSTLNLKKVSFTWKWQVTTTSHIQYAVDTHGYI